MLDNKIEKENLKKINKKQSMSSQDCMPSMRPRLQGKNDTV